MQKLSFDCICRHPLSAQKCSEVQQHSRFPAENQCCDPDFQTGDNGGAAGKPLHRMPDLGAGTTGCHPRFPVYFHCRRSSTRRMLSFYIAAALGRDCWVQPIRPSTRVFASRTRKHSDSAISRIRASNEPSCLTICQPPENIRSSAYRVYRRCSPPARPCRRRSRRLHALNARVHSLWMEKNQPDPSTGPAPGGSAALHS